MIHIGFLRSLEEASGKIEVERSTAFNTNIPLQEYPVICGAVDIDIRYDQILGIQFLPASSPCEAASPDKDHQCAYQK